MTGIRTGIPQGSPVSPILFLFASSGVEAFIQEGFRDDPRVQAGEVTLPTAITYIDDGMIYVSSKSLHTNVDYLVRAYTRAQECLRGEGMRIDQVKRELMHYSTRTNDKGVNPSMVLPGPQAQDPSSTIERTGAVKWLGIHFDRALSFDAHIRAARNKASGALERLRMLANTRSGLHQTMCRQLYIACVLPILTYASVVWHKGSDSYGMKGKVDTLDKVQRKALRWITGAFRTTPVRALELEAGILPMKHQLDLIRGLYATRLLTYDVAHPVIRRLPKEWKKPNYIGIPDTPHRTIPFTSPPLNARTVFKRSGELGNPPTRIHALARMVSDQTERTSPLFFPPWRRTRHDADLRSRFTVGRAILGIEKEEAAKSHRAHIKAFLHDPAHLLVYTDGSMLYNKQTGARSVGAAAVLVHQDEQMLHPIKMGMGDTSEVYDAELMALVLGMHKAVAQAKGTETDTSVDPIRHIHIFADNDAAVGRIVEQSALGGQIRAALFWELSKDFLDTHPENTIEVAWIPGHHGIRWNEVVDEAAKEATSEPCKTIPSIINARRRTRTTISIARKESWVTSKEEPGSSLFADVDFLPPKTKPFPWFLCLPRREYALIVQTRTGHGFFGDYYNRHVPSESPECDCRQVAVETRNHVLAQCPLHDEHRGILEEVSEGIDPSILLGTTEGILAVADFINATGAFTKRRRLDRNPDGWEYD